MQPEKFLPTPLAPAADEAALATIPKARRRIAAPCYILLTGEVFYWLPTSIATPASGSVVVPNEIAASAEYLNDPTTAPGRWEASAGGAVDALSAIVSTLLTRLGTIAKSTWTSVKTASYAAAVHDIVRYDATGGGFPITLPSATGLGADDAVSMVNDGISTNTVTVSVLGGAQMIRGNGGISAASYELAAPGATTVFIPNSTYWQAFPGG